LVDEPRSVVGLAGKVNVFLYDIVDFLASEVPRISMAARWWYGGGTSKRW
jgi:hypothetical protein